MTRDEIIRAITETHRRAMVHRIAAERLLKESRELEQRLAKEVKQARSAGPVAELSVPSWSSARPAWDWEIDVRALRR